MRVKHLPDSLGSYDRDGVVIDQHGDLTSWLVDLVYYV